MIIKIKYFEGAQKIEQTSNSDWIDLRSNISIELKYRQHYLIPLGIAMQLPKLYEAHMVSRSSTFKNFGIIQTNSHAVIDNSFCGSDDQWFFSALAMKATKIEKGDRICQFRLVQKQPKIGFVEILELQNISRGGHGSTGIK